MSDLISIQIEPTFRAWRTEARRLLAYSVHPDTVLWSDKSDAQNELFGSIAEPIFTGEMQEVSISKEFFDLARTAACHSDHKRWALLYRIAWRMACNGEKQLLKMPNDIDTRTAKEMVKAIGRDCHKMNAFVRFRKVGEDETTGREQFVAWFEPSHHIIEHNARFFIKRFTNMDWSILSPDQCIHWDGKTLHVTEGVAKDAAPDSDTLEELWLGYYRSIFNPARLKLKAMQAEMPKKYWKNLPEAALIEELSQQANVRKDEMIEKESIEPRPAPKNRYLNRLYDSNLNEAIEDIQQAIHQDKSVEELAEVAACCRACPLWERATQTVFGYGNPNADIMIIGEQPGDEEDIAGKPFVGPAGKLLDQALEEIGINRDTVYITNAVKHFKWKPSTTNNRRRIHDKASPAEVTMCKPWLVAEILKVKPKTIITLGNTAAQAVIRKDFKVLSERGRVKSTNQIDFGGQIIATVHPSFVLRNQSEPKVMKNFIEDLSFAAR